MLLLSLFFACEGHDHKHDTAEAVDIENLEADLDSGEGLYTSNCSSCHGSGAEGGTGPELIGTPLSHFVDSIQNGIGFMPAFPDLTDQDIADIYGYVQSL